MNNKYTWAVEDIYQSISEWNTDFNKATKLIDFSEFNKKLGKEESFYKCMKKQEKVSRLIEKLSVYAMMKHDENTADSNSDALLSKITNLSVNYGANTSFIIPEITSLKKSVIKGYIENPKFKEYDYFLKCILKNKEHVLSDAEEKLLANSGEALSSFREIFTKIDNADLPLGSFKYKNKTYTLTHGTYGLLMQNPDRKLRELAFKNYYKAYVSLINTISSVYYGNVKKDVFYAKAQKYNSSLESALSNEDVSNKVYENLINTVNGSLKYLHEYMSVKKKTLNLKSMHVYDIYTPLVKGADLKLEYDKAYSLVVEGLSVLGNEYVELLKKGHDERWIDVYEKKGKRSGAYSVAVYDTHPFVLLNYQKTTHDVFTIAHEMGHSIHSYFSNKNQPYFKADYKIFVAEVASTVNEVLLAKYLLKTAKEKKIKKYVLSYLLEMIRTTLYRQTQFAEFEEITHRKVENGEPLTKDELCKEYLSLNKKYYGKALYSDDEIKYEWARIPHFYRAFYVYKYATGIISALAIADRILTEGKPAVKDYFKFLSSGDSDSPVELLKIAGVNLEEIKPFESAFKFFKDSLDEFKSL